MNTDIEDSAEFRLHIRSLLYEYSTSHCTTDYVTFTEELVSEFIDVLKPVPLTDPYSFTIAVDPYHAFSKIHSLPSLPSYDENPRTTNDSLLYLKRLMRSVGKPKTEKIAWDDNYGDEPPSEPFYPALSRNARLNTPKLGRKGQSRSPESIKDVLKEQRIRPILVEPVQEPVLIFEDVLQLKYQIDPGELPAVRNLLQTTTDMLRPQKLYKNKYLNPTSLCNGFPDDPVLEPPEELFTPIFPRAPPPRSGVANANGKPRLSEFKDLVENPCVDLKKAQVEDPDGDISLQNLLVTVDGWETIKSSPPSTPSSRLSDDDEQIDQLFLPSSPNTEPTLVEEIENAKMDGIEMPRSRQIGGSSGITPHILFGKTLGSFLLPLFPPPNTETERKEAESRCSSPAPSSLLGQPPSALESDVIHEAGPKEEKRDDDLSVELEKLYKGQKLEDPIWNETIDEKQDLMMEVPSLPPPNVHPPNGMHVPKVFADFLLPPARKNEKKNRNPKSALSSFPHQFLKKAKGCQSLGLALSWVAFTVDTKLPSVLEIVDVVDLFPEQLYEGAKVNSESNYAKTMKLLKSMELSDPESSSSVPTWLRFGAEEADGLPIHNLDDDFQILLNRQERRRLAVMENRQHEYDASDDDGDGSCNMRDDSRVDYYNPVPELQSSSRYDHIERGDWDDGSDGSAEGERRHKRPKPNIVDQTSQHVADDVPSRRPVAFVNDPSGFELGCFEDGFPGLLSNEDGKEFWPPLSSSSFSRDMDEGSDYEQYVDQQAPEQAIAVASVDDDYEMEIVESFEPLSFGSRPLVPAARGFSQMGDIRSRDDDFQNYVEGNLCAENHFSDTIDGVASAENTASLPLLYSFSEPDIASHPLGISAFAQLRARKVSEPKPIPISKPAPQPISTEVPDQPLKAPPEIFDANTISLPETIRIAQSVHRYMGSVDLIQKHALVCALRSEVCAAEVIERQSLGGADLILDPCCAVVFLSLFTLSARCAPYVERISQQSWKFSRLLVIFEAYPEQQSKKTRSRRKPRGGASGPAAVSASVPELYAYTAPVLKAIKRFRRDVSIAEACGTKRLETVVQYAFANTVDEAALLTRWYGDQAEANDDTQAAVWGDRAWLGMDYLEDDETNLATIDGINHFSASIILCQVSLQDFINMSSEERIEGFGGYIELDAIMSCNADLEARFAAMQDSSCTLHSEEEHMSSSWN